MHHVDDWSTSIPSIITGQPRESVPWLNLSRRATSVLVPRTVWTSWSAITQWILLTP